MLAPDDQRDDVHENEDRQQDGGRFDRRDDEGEEGNADQRKGISHAAFREANEQHGGHCRIKE